MGRVVKSKVSAGDAKTYSRTPFRLPNCLFFDSPAQLLASFLRFKKTVKSAWNTPVYQVALARPECDSLCVLGKKGVFFETLTGQSARLATRC